MVEWIEITEAAEKALWFIVSTLVVEWIEIKSIQSLAPSVRVSTLVVEWIEMEICNTKCNTEPGLHPRGGVD